MSVCFFSSNVVQLAPCSCLRQLALLFLNISRARQAADKSSFVCLRRKLRHGGQVDDVLPVIDGQSDQGLACRIRMLQLVVGVAVVGRPLVFLASLVLPLWVLVGLQPPLVASSSPLTSRPRCTLRGVPTGRSAVMRIVSWRTWNVSSRVGHHRHGFSEVGDCCFPKCSIKCCRDGQSSGASEAMQNVASRCTAFDVVSGKSTELQSHVARPPHAGRHHHLLRGVVRQSEAAEWTWHSWARTVRACLHHGVLDRQAEHHGAVSLAAQSLTPQKVAACYFEPNITTEPSLS